MIVCIGHVEGNLSGPQNCGWQSIKWTFGEGTCPGAALSLVQVELSTWPSARTRPLIQVLRVNINHTAALNEQRIVHRSVLLFFMVQCMV